MKIDKQQAIVNTLISMADIYYNKRYYNTAIKYGNKALGMAQKIGAIPQSRDATQIIYNAYKKVGRYKTALKVHEQYVALNDSILKEENRKYAQRQKYKYQQEKEIAIDSVIDQKKKETLKAYSVASEAKQSHHLLKKQRRQFIFFLIGFILLVIFLGMFILRKYRSTSKHEKVIEKSDDQIVESINYSKKIQTALLPDISDIEKTINDVFIYFKPKEIVSGDFYWYKNFDHHTLIACVDCTGHGVPGGFMSTLGSLLLDKVGNDPTQAPGAILKHLSDEIIKALQQEKGGDIQDGMDISLCLIDKKNKKIEFSGARNGIIVIRNNKAERYKASTLPVGGNYLKKGKPIERKFESKTVLFDKSDWIFMYTDGYMEQIGGNKNLPMNYKEFERILLNTINYSKTSDKITYLDNTHKEWKKENDQFDDILIIGFKPAFQHTESNNFLDIW